MTGRVHGLLLLLLAGLLAIRAGDPWRYLHDDNGRRFSSYARSHRTLGLARTRGQDFFYAPRTGVLRPYGHHPPGLGLLLAAWFGLWGRDTPLVARALAAGFHLSAVWLLLRVLAEQYPGGPGLVAGFALAVVPMSAFFGKMVNYEPFVLPFFVLAIVGYWRWAEGGPRRALLLGLGLAPLAALIDWPILFALATVAGDAVRRWWRGRQRRFLVVGLGVAALGAATFLAVTAWLATGPAGLSELGAAAAFRTRLPRSYSWTHWIGKVIDYHRRYLGEPLLVSSVLTAGAVGRRVLRGCPLSPRVRLIVLFGVAGLLPVLVFPNGARFHPYWQFYLLPAGALCLAHVLAAVAGRVGSRRAGLVYAVVVLWLAAASSVSLHVRYTRPSGYVAKMVRRWEAFL